MRHPFRLIAPLLLLAGAGAAGQAAAPPRQFIVLNLSRGATSETVESVRRVFPGSSSSPVQIGVAAIFSYLGQPRPNVEQHLRNFLRLAAEFETPIVVQLDGENWWQARPDLWNWWNPAGPGFSDSNRFNVEWTGWSPDHAIKISWRNWGRQLRVLPAPNLMSPRYREACHEEMRRLIPIVLDWWNSLAADRKHLLIGIKLGWESSIGVNAWYYPNGNNLLDRPATEDPSSGLDAAQVPARGVAQIGFAAVRMAGIRTSGQISEADLAEVVRRHLEDLCAAAARLGVPRDRLFTHGAGWKDGERLYAAAVNRFSCPGWSFYRHAADPGRDEAVRAALATSDAPYWAAVEWMLDGPPEAGRWEDALRCVLTVPRCRYVCIYNWEGIRDKPGVLDGIRGALRTNSSAATDSTRVRRQDAETGDRPHPAASETTPLNHDR